MTQQLGSKRKKKLLKSNKQNLFTFEVMQVGF